MKNYGVTWTDPAAINWAPGVSYDAKSAGQRTKKLVAERSENVEASESNPGVLPTIKD
ncbi:hypothetical protein [Streptomyces sp. NPDC055099]